jgi:hypothetical protein
MIFFCAECAMYLKQTCHRQSCCLASTENSVMRFFFMRILHATGLGACLREYCLPV